jgi:hypothetical protein
MNNQKQQTDNEVPSSAFASVEEMSHPPELQGNYQQEQE